MYLPRCPQSRVRDGIGSFCTGGSWTRREVGEGASHLFSEQENPEGKKKQPWQILIPSPCTTEAGARGEVAWISPSKNPAGLNFLFASPVVLTPRPHPHSCWKGRTSDGQRVIKGGPRASLWTCIQQRPHEKNLLCESTLQSAKYFPICCRVGPPNTQHNGVKAQVPVPALPLTSHVNLGQFLSSFMPQISHKYNGIIVMPFS